MSKVNEHDQNLFISETLKLRIMNEPLSKLADKEICSVKSPSSSYTCKGGRTFNKKLKIVLQAYPHNIDLIPIYFSWQVFPVQVDPDSDENVHMFFARGERWRRLRSIVNPAFSSTKMRTVRKNKYFSKKINKEENIFYIILNML